MSDRWISIPSTPPDKTAREAAQARQTRLTKPPGSLGQMECLAVRLASLQGTNRPQIGPIHITVFVADHGVADESVSAFPQAVTASMVKNFAGGGAAISVLARELDATLSVINLGTVVETGPVEGVLSIPLGAGTANFCKQAAMEESQLSAALMAGREAVERAARTGAQLFIGGEMGIANTTSASALACALLNTSPQQMAGPGTGLDADGVARKVSVVERALSLHGPHLHSPLEILRRLGGFEIAALTGSYVACAQMGVTVLVDGFISSVAALAASRLCPGAEAWWLFSHTSAEPGHQAVLDALDAHPLLDLGLRLGEASGAAIAVPLLKLACALHSQMATFDEAGVPGRSG